MKNCKVRSTMMIDVHYIREKLWYRGFDLSINETVDWIENNCHQAETTEDVLRCIPLLNI